MREIIVDFTGMEVADCENNATAYFGGIVKIREGENEATFFPYGTDRDGDMYDSLKEFIEVNFGLNYDSFIKRMMEDDDADEEHLIDSEEYYNWRYFEYGPYAKIIADDDGNVQHVESYEPITNRLAEMIRSNLSEMLNGPGTHMAYDGEIEFGYKWENGETTVFLEHEGAEIEQKFKIQIVEA